MINYKGYTIYVKHGEVGFTSLIYLNDELKGTCFAHAIWGDNPEESVLKKSITEINRLSKPSFYQKLKSLIN